MNNLSNNNWAFILGGSSGFGLATAKLLSGKGYNLFIAHRDSRINHKKIEAHFNEIKANKMHFASINTNAITKDGQQKILAKIRVHLKENGKIKVFLHSIADGNLRSIIPDTPHNNGSKAHKDEKGLLEDDFHYTIQSMGTSFIIWSKLLLENNLFAENARIIGLTSEGSHRALPHYSAVAAAKGVLETSCRYLAKEFAQYGITTNLINAGISDTPALRSMPAHKEIIKNAIRRNPFKRLTCPEDVANVVYLLTLDQAGWINGEIIRVDGGEQIVF